MSKKTENTENKRYDFTRTLIITQRYAVKLYKDGKVEDAGFVEYDHNPTPADKHRLEKENNAQAIILEKVGEITESRGMSLEDFVKYSTVIERVDTISKEVN